MRLASKLSDTPAMQRYLLTPSDVPIKCSTDVWIAPSHIPSRHLASGFSKRTVLAILYNTFSPKRALGEVRDLPRLRCMAVSPSSPLILHINSVWAAYSTTPTPDRECGVNSEA